MNLMNKFSKILTIAMVLLISAVFAGAAMAVDGSASASPIKNVDDVVKIIGNIVVIMYRVFFVVAIGAVIWAAFIYLTSKDDPEKIKNATKQILWAVVAIAIGLASVGFSKIIDTFITSGK